MHLSIICTVRLTVWAQSSFEFFLRSTGGELRWELIIYKWQTSAKGFKRGLFSASTKWWWHSVFAVFVFVFALFVRRGLKGDNFYSLVAFWWVPCAEAVFARGLCAATLVFAAAEVVFVQITGKMGPLYHFVSRVVRCASFYIPSPIAGNHPFTEAAASSSVTTVWKWEKTRPLWRRFRQTTLERGVADPTFNPPRLPRYLFKKS